MFNIIYLLFLIAATVPITWYCNGLYYILVPSSAILLTLSSIIITPLPCNKKKDGEMLPFIWRLCYIILNVLSAITLATSIVFIAINELGNGVYMILKLVSVFTPAIISPLLRIYPHTRPCLFIIGVDLTIFIISMILVISKAYLPWWDILLFIFAFISAMFSILTDNCNEFNKEQKEEYLKIIQYDV